MDIHLHMQYKCALYAGTIQISLEYNWLYQQPLMLLKRTQVWFPVPYQATHNIL